MTSNLNNIKFFYKTLNEASPSNLIKKRFIIKNDQIYLKNLNLNQKKMNFNINKKMKIDLLSFGKASIDMHQHLLNIISKNHIGKELIITHLKKDSIPKNLISKKIVFSSHPHMTTKSLIAGKKIYDFFNKSKNKYLIVAVSGGGSAMIVYPVPGLNLKSKLDYFKKLMFLGYPEREITIIKKSLSLVKGGKLLANTKYKKIINLILSDERSHNIKAISSGISIPNQNINPISIMNKYNIWKHTPKKIQKLLLNYKNKKSLSKSEVNSFIIGSREDFFKSLMINLKKRNYKKIYELKNYHSITPQNAVKKFINKIKNIYKLSPIGKNVIIVPAEIQVNIDNFKNHKGGRNQHFISLFMLAENFNFKFFISAIATDGMDYLDGIHGAFYSSELKYKIKNNQEFIKKKNR